MSQKSHAPSHVSWHVELSVRSGKLEQFIELTREMVVSTMNESGVLHFERFLSDDETKVHVYERYVDSQSAIAHLRTFQEQFSERFSKLVERNRFEVFGAPNAELTNLLERFGAKFFKKLDGFSSIA